jgi:hypothetical protein
MFIGERIWVINPYKHVWQLRYYLWKPLLYTEPIPTEVEAILGNRIWSESRELIHQIWFIREQYCGLVAIPFNSIEGVEPILCPSFSNTNRLRYQHRPYQVSRISRYTGNISQLTVGHTIYLEPPRTYTGSFHPKINSPDQFLNTGNWKFIDGTPTLVEPLPLIPSSSIDHDHASKTPNTVEERGYESEISNTVIVVPTPTPPPVALIRGNKGDAL